ncbi:large transcriptional regulator [Sandaracinus amylolyticus]|uniref:Large transcriptional regulator n=1 Tax=Sandaracinus amylolyticus TaxID=927083 RepID=A0A0F6SHM4_9BACT|nr:large transcriptional regulator [Sandaracinus amylolyticus]
MRVDPGSRPGLHLRLLGELEASASGARLALPPSKKTRALLAYLALTGRAHRRERLSDLLWDVTDDRRAALRWSLTKLRDVVDVEGRERLRADREHVSLDLSDVHVDVLEVREMVGSDVESAPTPVLERALERFGGELLEGLDLDDFPVFHAWCVAERSDVRQLRARILTTLLERARGNPQRALPYARDLVQLDPSDAAARARLQELLHASGRYREAEAQSRTDRRLLGAPALEALGDARISSSPRAPGSLAPLVGRRAELASVRAAIEAGAPPVLVLLGEPGIGKSRLCAEIVRELRDRGAPVLEGRALEVHPGWPFGAWIDAFRALDTSGLDPVLATTLAPLLTPAVAPDEAPAQGRERLFHAASEALASRGVWVVLEDAHWLDESSIALAHHVVHACAQRGVRLLLTAREGELADNPFVSRVLRALRKADLVHEIQLAPLGRDETAQLVGSDADDLYEQSGGNPLFALELARAPRTSGTVPRSITRVVRDRLDALSAETGDALRWAAVLGASFDLVMLEGALAVSEDALVGTIEELERHGWVLAVTSDVERAPVYRFAHEIVRRAVYDALSEPRRRLMHGKVARLVAARPDVDGSAVSTIAHHAALAGDFALAARACRDAGERSMRLHAAADAFALARRGLSYVDKLADPERTTRAIDLLYLALRARRPDDRGEAIAKLAELTERALDLGAHDHARIGFYLRAFLEWEDGEAGDVRSLSDAIERTSRLGSARERVLGFGDAAHCLVSIERDLPRAEALILEAEAIAAREHVESFAVSLTRAMLRAHKGDLDAAEEHLERALEIARRTGDRLQEYVALERQIDVDLQRGALDRARGRAERLIALGERTREGSERPHARALRALIEHATERGHEAALDEAIAALIAADSKRRCAYVLVRAAEIELDRGEHDTARRHALDALDFARRIDAPSDIAGALAALARIGDHDALGALRDATSRVISERARRAAAKVGGTTWSA